MGGQEVIHVWLTLLVLVFGAGAFAVVVWLAERKGRAELQKEQHDAEVRRLHDAVEADAAVRRDIAAGRLLEDDGHRRD